MKPFQIFLLSIVLLFTACRKDIEISDDYFIPIGGGDLVSSQLTGQIIDQAGQPISEATVIFEQLQVRTNEDGVFSFATMDLESNGQVLTVEKEGFFKSYKKIIPLENQTFQRIGLVTKSDPTGSFLASQGGNISKPTGESILFQSKSIRTETDEEYQGTVTVFSHHFNPRDPFFYETMPGDLSAIDKNGSLVQLATYSMVLVELFGENGEPLNLKKNMTATVEFPIKGDAINSAPDFIPLWSLDENTGTWIEEGQATKQGNYYIGEVPHFSFWNCDVPFNFIELEGTVIDIEGNFLANQRINIEMVNGGDVRSTFTNLEGKFAGGVPKNELLTLRIVNFCGVELFNVDIGPFNLNQKIDITIDISENSFLLTGSVKNCDGVSVEDGYAVAERSTGLKEIIPIDSEGNFSYPISSCLDGDFSVYGIDQQTFNRSPKVTIIDNGQGVEDVGTLETCQELISFFSVTANGTQELLLDELADNGSTMQNNTLMMVMQSTEGFVYLIIPNPTLGVNNPSEISTESSNFDLGCKNSFPCNGNFTIELSKFENFLGGYVEGTASGSLSDDNGDVESVTMEFRIQLVNVLSDYSGVIWEDLNKDGIRDSNEVGVEDILIEYRSPSIAGGLQVYEEIFSNTDGTFLAPISELNNGSLTITLPAGYVTTIQNQGSDESLDSDFPQGESTLEFPIEDLATPNLLDIGIHLE